MDPVEKFIKLKLGQTVALAIGPGKVVGRTVNKGGVCRVLVQCKQIDPLTDQRMVWSINPEDISNDKTARQDH